MTLLRPRYWPGHLAMVVCVAIATGLGVWQFDAWQQRRDDAARNITDEKPVGLDRVMSGDDPFPGRDVGRPVSFSGTWTGPNVYVSDREHDGRRGYWVVTALRVDGTSSAMPVVRGWSADAEQSVPSGHTSVIGWLQPTEGSGPFDEDPTDDVIPSMRIASLVEKIDADLYSGFVLADVIPGQQGLGRLTPATADSVSAFTGLRNLFYALEWWVFAGFAFFVWWRWCDDELHPPADEDDA